MYKESGSIHLQSGPFDKGWPEYNTGAKYVNKIRKEDLLGLGDSPSLISFYSSKYSSSAPTGGWLQRIRLGNISLNGQDVSDPQVQLKAGDVLEYFRQPWKEPEAPHELQILFEDEHVLLVNKPSGLQVIRGGIFYQRTVLTLLEHWRSSGDEPIPTPVHRLGRGTSGVLVCAKSMVAKRKLSSDFAFHSTAGSVSSSKANSDDPNVILKTYRGLCQGVIDKDEILVETPIGRENYNGVAEGLFMASPKGKPSMSRIRVLHRDVDAKTTIVEVDLFTGRAHQIRIHTAVVGHPLVGDPLYIAGGVPSAGNNTLTTLMAVGSDRNSVPMAADGGHERPSVALPGDCGYLLHAIRIQFNHPLLLRNMTVIAPPPPELMTPFERESSQ